MTYKNLILRCRNFGLNYFIWAIAFLSLSNIRAINAQVVEDNSLSTEVNTENNLDFEVDGGEERGNNLFHSFTDFSIPNNGSVSFNNNLTIQNIITRVTGSNISDINGLIQSNGSASLFLINPNGIIFGENARLELGGSFIGTTASSLVFEDGTRFSSNLAESNPLLTLSVPLGLQFGSNPGAITNQANFSIPNPMDPNLGEIKLGLTTPGNTLALLGGEIFFDNGATTAPGGNIELGGVFANSFVGLEAVEGRWQANYDSVEQFENVQFDNLAVVDTSSLGGGNIRVRGQNIQLFNGSTISSNTLGDLDGSLIELRANNVVEINGSDLTGTNIDPFLAGLEIFLPLASQVTSNTFGSGQGGDVQIVTQDLRVIDGGSISVQTISDSGGQGGNVFISAAGSINLNGTRPLLGVGENAQNIILPTVDLDTAIDINQASEISVASILSGNAGNINISAQNIQLLDGATIASSPFNNGNGGNINLEATEIIEVMGTSPRTGTVSSAIAANTFNQGDAGNINLNTKRLSLLEGGVVASTNSLINGGEAGNININSQLIEIDGISVDEQQPSLLSSETHNDSPGGGILLNTDSLTISNQGVLDIRGSGSGSPGNLTVNANAIDLNRNASITAENSSAIEGGNINLQLQDNLTLTENSTISAQAVNEANGGNITIDSQFLIAFPNQNNNILANSFSGSGGNISISARGIFGIEEGIFQAFSQNNSIDASSEFGQAGNVSLFFPQFTATEKLAILTAEFVDVNFLFRNNFCKISRDSKYTVTGKGGIPSRPEDDLSPDNTWSDWRLIDSDNALKKAEVIKPKVSKNQELNLIQGWTRDSQGRVVLTANPSSGKSSPSSFSRPSCNQTTYQ